MNNRYANGVPYCRKQCEPPCCRQGPPGETGATGARGEQGSAGCKGERGEMGPQGVTGPQGLQGATGPQGPQGEQGIRGAIGPPGCSQNSIFAVFEEHKIFMPEKAYLPLKPVILDLSENITPCTGHSVTLNQGYYAVYYYASVRLKKPGSTKIMPVINNSLLRCYMGCADTNGHNENAVISREFIVEIPACTQLSFIWKCEEITDSISFNINILKLYR